METINHREREHAFLSPSSAYRWMRCTASPFEEEQLPDVSSSYAEEGTKAHEVCEIILESAKGADDERLQGADPEMVRHALTYREYIQTLEHGADSTLFVEERVKLSLYEDLCWGTADAIYWHADGHLDIIDYKYGAGVAVDAVENKQASIYAISALNTLNGRECANLTRINTRDIKTITVHIYQPRINNISVWRTDLDDLRRFFVDELVPAIEAIKANKLNYNAGDHCRFCKARATCSAFKEHYFNRAKAFQAMDANKLTDQDYNEVLELKETLTKWLEEVETHLINRIKDGTPLEGYKLIQGTSRRSISNQAKALEVLRANGYKDEETTEVKLLGITALTKLLGGKKVAELLTPYITKSTPAPKLVTNETHGSDYITEKTAGSIEDFKINY